MVQSRGNYLRACEGCGSGLTLKFCPNGPNMPSPSLFIGLNYVYMTCPNKQAGLPVGLTGLLVPIFFVQISLANFLLYI